MFGKNKKYICVKCGQKIISMNVTPHICLDKNVDGINGYVCDKCASVERNFNGSIVSYVWNGKKNISDVIGVLI
jgi:hypothetical protein